jgi:hypothetical protein
MDPLPPTAVFGQRSGRMQVYLTHEVGVLGGADVGRPTWQRLGRQAPAFRQTQVAVDGTAVDAEHLGHYLLRLPGLDGGHDALAQIETVGTHAPGSFPEPHSIPPAQSLCKPL